jgi:hypothetical protein
MMQIIDPGMKDVESNDAARLRAIVSIARLDVPFSRFEEIVDGLDVDLTDMSQKGDLVDRVSAAKKLLQSRARDYERRADEEKAGVLAEEAKAGDAGGAVRDPLVVNDELARAIERRTTLKGQLSLAKQCAASRSEAEAALASLTADETILPIEQAVERVREATRELSLAKEALEVAKRNLMVADHKLQMAANAERVARSNEASVQSWLVVLEKPVTLEPSDDEIRSSEDAVTALQEELAASLLATDRAAHARIAQDRRKVMEGYEATARSLRAACESVDGLLTEALQVPFLRWEVGRLIYVHPDGREELFQRLSDGIRTDAAGQIVAQAVGVQTGDGTGMVVLNQSAWQHLDPDRRDLLNEVALKYRITILAAECTSDRYTVQIHGRAETYDELLNLVAA